MTFYTQKAAVGPLPARNFVTAEKNLGDLTEMWHGIDITVNARLRNGLTLQLGTGHRSEDHRSLRHDHQGGPANDSAPGLDAWRASAGVELLQQGAFPDEPARIGELHRAEGGCPRQRHVPIAGA
jgi:hypothetical protein